MKLPKNVRKLNPEEKMLAYTVFLNTIPLDFIRLTDGLGYNDRPFTINVPSDDPAGMSPILNVFLGGTTKYPMSKFFIYLNVGPSIYRNAFLYKPATFIHEMTHAWQYLHGNHVVLDSLYSQATSHDAYTYKPGAAWDSYNVEQQASIVEDWFKSHANKRDRQKYMENNIWKGKIK